MRILFPFITWIFPGSMGNPTGPFGFRAMPLVNPPALPYDAPVPIELSHGKVWR